MIVCGMVWIELGASSLEQEVVAAIYAKRNESQPEKKLAHTSARTKQRVLSYPLLSRGLHES